MTLINFVPVFPDLLLQSVPTHSQSWASNSGTPSPRNPSVHGQRQMWAPREANASREALLVKVQWTRVSKSNGAGAG